jgi:hypothetical protein
MTFTRLDPESPDNRSDKGLILFDADVTSA